MNITIAQTPSMAGQKARLKAPLSHPVEDKVKILLVDDEPSNLALMKVILSGLNQEIFATSSGEEALDLLEHHEFAVILLDGLMHGMDGFETAEKIRQRPLSRTTPIIFVTGSFITEDNVSEGYSCGAIDYLTKPVNPAILRAKVRGFVQLARVQAKLEWEMDEKIRIAAAMGKLNLELERKNRELKVANSHLEAFSYSVAHDLRAPLSNIVGYLGLVEMSKVDVSEEVGEYLGKASKAAKRMGNLIRDMLDFARADRAALVLNTVDLNRMIEEIREEDLQEADRQIEWHIAPLPVRGDQALLRQALTNLLSNAVKYTAKRDVAQIEIGWTDARQEIVFFIRDNGAGFDMKDASKLFGVFQRLHSKAQFEGTGIGLSTVRSIVERHGGRTWAEGKTNEGSVFYLSLPK